MARHSAVRRLSALQIEQSRGQSDQGGQTRCEERRCGCACWRARFATTPLLSAPKEARQKVSAWLSDVARTAAGKSLKQLLENSKPVRSLIEAVADGSPYLWELASADPARLLALLQSDPDEHLAALLPTAADAVAAAER